MDSLLQLREELDQIDEEIIKLYLERMKICDSVGDYKIKAGRQVLDRKREDEKLSHVASKVDGDFNKVGIREVFSQLMSLSRKLQYQKLASVDVEGEITFLEVDDLKFASTSVVYQGIKGSYGQEAAKQFFGEGLELYGVATFRLAMEEIANGRADYAVLPIENSSMGSVREVYDLWDEFENYIVARQIIPINHVLAGLPGATLEQVNEVYSKTEALMQVSRYLEQQKDWQQIDVTNTAVAAKKIVEDNDPSKVAVCSAYAAKVYGLDILAKNINNEENNFTRFVVITDKKVFLNTANKISICFELPHESGSLYNLLSHFVYNNLNMTKIESRPIEGRIWEYRFFVDFEGSLADPEVKIALRGLGEEAKNLKILGNYP
jgi:chorismate mutase/prephenate dehydratase